MVAFFIAALIFAAAPWYVFTRVLRDDKPSKPASTASHTPSPSPSASPTSRAGEYEVITTSKCLNVRGSPGTDQKRVLCLPPGTKVTSDGRLANAGGIEWLHVTHPQGSGWASTQYLKKIG
jgi:hypothetical protein